MSFVYRVLAPIRDRLQCKLLTDTLLARDSLTDVEISDAISFLGSRNCVIRSREIVAHANSLISISPELMCLFDAKIDFYLQHYDKVVQVADDLSCSTNAELAAYVAASFAIMGQVDELALFLEGLQAKSLDLTRVYRLAEQQSTSEELLFWLYERMLATPLPHDSIQDFVDFLSESRSGNLAVHFIYAHFELSNFAVGQSQYLELLAVAGEWELATENLLCLKDPHLPRVQQAIGLYYSHSSNHELAMDHWLNAIDKKLDSRNRQVLVSNIVSTCNEHKDIPSLVSAADKYLNEIGDDNLYCSLRYHAARMGKNVFSAAYWRFVITVRPGRNASN